MQAPSRTPVGLGAMTAALVIVPADPVCATSASAHGGRVPGSSVRAASSRTRPGPREVLSGAPWMVRLSMGCGDLMSPARLAPARKHPLGPHRSHQASAPTGFTVAVGHVTPQAATSARRQASYH